MSGLPATGIGSWPGTSIDEAVRQSADLWALPYLPELPARGPWAEMLGRALGTIDIGIERGPSRWQVSATSSSDQRRCRAMLRDDYDVLAERFSDYTGPLKVSLAGPYTLLACVDLVRGEAMVSDAGARRELVQAHAAALGDLVRRLRQLVPGAQPVVQLDEPMLGMVAEGAVRSASGIRRYDPVDAEEIGRAYRELCALVDRAGASPLVVHSCAPAPWRTLVEAGIGAAAVDADQPGNIDVLAEHVDAGGDLWLGIVPTGPGSAALSVDQVVARALDWLRPLELGRRLDGHLVLTPACGLAGFSPAAAVRVAETLAEAGDLVAERLFS
jgi:hypothetical protein